MRLGIICPLPPCLHSFLPLHSSHFHSDKNNTLNALTCLVLPPPHFTLARPRTSPRQAKGFSTREERLLRTGNNVGSSWMRTGKRLVKVAFTDTIIIPHTSCVIHNSVTCKHCIMHFCTICQHSYTHMPIHMHAHTKRTHTHTHICTHTHTTHTHTTHNTHTHTHTQHTHTHNTHTHTTHTNTLILPSLSVSEDADQGFTCMYSCANSLYSVCVHIPVVYTTVVHEW